MARTVSIGTQDFHFNCMVACGTVGRGNPVYAVSKSVYALGVAEGTDGI